MANGITIVSREWISDPMEPSGRKEVITFSVLTADLIDNILDLYPKTGNGSFALCLSEGVCKTLIDGIWA